MTEFLRVRDDRTGSEYDAPVESLEASPNPHLTVIDKEPVTEQRPPKHGDHKSVEPPANLFGSSKPSK